MSVRVSLEQHLPTTPERVFAALTDLDGAKAWLPNLERIERLDDKPFGIGTAWRETRRIFGREATEHHEVTRCEHGRALSILVDGTKGVSKRGAYRFDYALAADDGGTLLKLDAEISGMGLFMSLLGKLFAAGFKSGLEGDLHALRRYVEDRDALPVAAREERPSDVA